MTNSRENPLTGAIETAFSVFHQVLEDHQPTLAVESVGTVTSAGHGIARVRGLAGVRNEELLDLGDGLTGLAFNVDERETGVILLGESERLAAGDEVRRTGRVIDVPVGEGLVGRVVDATASPLDGRGPLSADERRPVERPAPAIMDRSPVTVPLQTGIKVVDALIPVGRGQRELILGDRQTGKTAIALDTVLNQRDGEVICIYCGVGKRGSAVAKLIADLRRHGAMDYTTVVLATEDDPPGLQYIAPYAATTMGEYFTERGRDVLIIYDDLTRHARSYRELSLLLRRPPGREAYPGDIFYIHSRLLERSTHLRDENGGGSLTALPIVETEAQNLSAYIPTNLISITDGQIYLSPDLFQQGILPAVDVGRSVSRVGGKTQLPAYRTVAGDLRLSYSQFTELESFARFGTRLDAETRKTLDRGRRVREILKQPQYETLPVCEQIAVLLAVNRGAFDEIPLSAIDDAAEQLREIVRTRLTELCDRITAGESPSDEDIRVMLDAARKAAQAAAPERAEAEADADA
jgi:F-type H+/Na+-transporting ATPase subunit alpha